MSVEVEEADRENSVRIARRNLVWALYELDGDETLEHNIEHALANIEIANIYLKPWVEGLTDKDESATIKQARQ